MKNQTSGARRSAIYLLDQILGEGALMPELLGAGALDRLEPSDRARAQRLATDVLRGLERVDRLLKKHLRKTPPLTVQNVLRLGVIEICQGGASHGIVNEAVEMVAHGKRTSHMKGLVNAVLRKVAIDGPAEWEKLRVPRLPKWLRGPMVDAYGGEVVGRMEAAHFAGAPLDITAKTDPEAVAKALEGEVLPVGSIRLGTSGQVSAMAGFAQGDWWVQDAAAVLPAKILAARPGENVLDLCAAPGGKTMQLAASGATVTALDISQGRMGRVRENLKRTGLSAEIIVEDALSYDGGPYDAILLDAPCSATGTIRRHPDLPHAKDGAEFGTLFQLQSDMIDHALTLLKPGGRLVYCTCSLLPDEGECQIDDALARHEGLRTDRDALSVAGIEADWITQEGGLRLRPDYWADKGGMDGFYIACLIRP